MKVYGNYRDITPTMLLAIKKFMSWEPVTGSVIVVSDTNNVVAGTIAVPCGKSVVAHFCEDGSMWADTDESFKVIE